MKRFQPLAKQLIDGVRTKTLSVHADERGRLVEMLRSDDEFFERFGQAYLTTAYPGVVKAWHYHKKQVDRFVCVHGMMKVVLYDDREGSPTRGLLNEFFLGVHHPLLLRIPAGVYHGFKCISECEALIVNIPTEVYHYAEPDEFRIDAHDPRVPYDWARRDG
ncbi:MAG: dTDP-4-dehydrorhamnose 3,5-epimerase [Gemmatimonadetes bacterium GWC2_71_9]|nr:MAG: dTDP-4-dehydrorhamnose 3,5-epimerase [Gemmatimonadetes bacterium RIFCSPLOWO2_02_FULL_71_11]OGT95605.1 MAG: dTDP-4-dehydrorhamnose 3,5-epimerase [Gemmatimonadetes bacterium GWC2_71_9]